MDSFDVLRLAELLKDPSKSESSISSDDEDSLQHDPAASRRGNADQLYNYI